jgi:diguanylate cyclase (GGDEF)-like protein
VRGTPDGTETEFALASLDLDTLIADGRYGQVSSALDRLDELLPALEGAADHEALLRGLSGRVCLLRLRQTSTPDLVIACDLLERAAEDRRKPVWKAVAQALRAQTHVDDADIAAAMADLGGLDLDQLDSDLSGASGYQLLDVLAGTYTRLRLHDRADSARRRIEEHVDSRSELERAAHWVGWGVELTRRAIEPLASGAEHPDLDLLDRAASIAAEISHLAPDNVPDRLLRVSGGIRALSAAYREKPSESLRLLGKDAFADPRDLPAMERQVLTLAAMRAHALLGSIATARSLDESATRHVGTLFDTILEVARARERLWLESLANGDVVPVLTRLTELLARLAWQGMDLITDTARQSLEHHVLRAESRTDALTGVGNRRALDEELRNMLRAGPLPLALVLVDVDGFKQVNDRFTHLVGDEVLRRVATALSQQLRLGDKILRYGGDEFVILLPGTADQEAQHVADRMSRAIARLPWSDLAESLSIGITTGYASVWTLSGRRPEKDAEMLFRHADEALLAAKTARGRGRDIPLSQQRDEKRRATPSPLPSSSLPPSPYPLPSSSLGPSPYPPVPTFDDDPLASRTARDRELAPPPEPGRAEIWSRPTDPLTDPAWVDAAMTGSLPLSAMTSAAMESPAPARSWWQELAPGEEPGAPAPDQNSHTRTQRVQRRSADPDREETARYSSGHDRRSDHEPGHRSPPEEPWRTSEPPRHRPPPDPWYDAPRRSNGGESAPSAAPSAAEWRLPAYPGQQPPAAPPPAHDDWQRLPAPGPAPDDWQRPPAPGPAPDDWQRLPLPGPPPNDWQRPPPPGPPPGPGAVPGRPGPEPEPEPEPEPTEQDWEDPWYRSPEEDPPDPPRSPPSRRRHPPVIDFPGEDDPRSPFG